MHEVPDGRGRKELRNSGLVPPPGLTAANGHPETAFSHGTAQEGPGRGEKVRSDQGSRRAGGLWGMTDVTVQRRDAEPATGGTLLVPTAQFCKERHPRRPSTAHRPPRTTHTLTHTGTRIKDTSRLRPPCQQAVPPGGTPELKAPSGQPGARKSSWDYLDCLGSLDLPVFGLDLPGRPPPNPCLNQTFHSLLPLLCHRMLLVRILLRKYLTDYQRASGNNQDHGSTPFATSSHLVRLFRFSCSTRPAPGWHQPGATECVSEAHQHSFLTVLVGPGPGPGGRPQFEHSVRFPSWCFNRHPRVSLGCAAWLGCGWLGRPVLAARRRLLVSASRVEQCTTPTRPRPTSQQGEKGQSRVDSRQSNNP